MSDPQTTPSVDDITAKILADPSASAIAMCEQEDKLIAAETEITRLRAALEKIVFTIMVHETGIDRGAADYFDRVQFTAREALQHGQ